MADSPGQHTEMDREDILYAAIGVFMGIAASVLTCLGMTLQQSSLMSPGEDVPVWKQQRWLVGMGSIVVGSLVDFMSFGLAPQSLLAPLAALTLIWNLFLARQYLGEEFGSIELKATAMIFLGTVLVVIFAVSFLGERPSLREWIGLSLIAVGVLTLAFKK